jgi:hypothetical protein
VREAELGRIKVFWLLSTLLDNMGLGLGVFRFDSLESELAISAGKASFNDAKSTARRPASRQRARWTSLPTPWTLTQRCSF